MRAGKRNLFDGLEELQASYNASQANKIDVSELKQLKQSLKKVCNEAEKKIQEIKIQDKERLPTAGKLRSGTTRRGKANSSNKKESCLYTQGKYINLGMEQAKESFDKDEIEYLEDTIKKVKTVNKLTYDQLKYLITNVYLQQLIGIKNGDIESSMHTRYMQQGGKNTQNLCSEIKAKLFTNEQRDYINGCLQGIFDATKLDDDGHIKHFEIDYLSTVMFYEITILIVQHVLKFDTYEAARQHMIKYTNESYD